MPIGHFRSPRRLAATAALVTALSALPHEIGREKAHKARVVENYRPPEVDLEKFKRFFPGLDVALTASKLFELRRDLTKRRELVKTLSESDLVVLIDSYLEKASKDSGVDLGILRFVFYNGGFNTRNPLVVSRWVALDLSKIEQDPFLGIDLGIAHFQLLKKRFQYKNPYKLLTDYLGVKADLKQLRKKVLGLNKKYEELFRRHDTFKKADLKLKMTRIDLSNFEFVPWQKFVSMGLEKQKAEIEKFVRFVCPQLDLRVNPILELIHNESSFDFQKRNKETGALGLMQIMPITFEELKRLGADFRKIFGQEISFVDLKDPYVNLIVGSLYFRYLLDALGNDYEAAFRAYQIGLPKYFREIDGLPVSRGTWKVKIARGN